MINTILSAAVKLYLRSQVEQAEKLDVKILGKNRQVLKGYIPQVILECDRAIYQGLHLNQVKVRGTNIGFNLSEVLKKKPFKLLEPIIIEVQLRLDSKDLQASLASPLLQSGLSDLWSMITPAKQTGNTGTIVWHNLEIASKTLNLIGTYQDADGKTSKLHLSTGVKLADSHTLDFSPVKIDPNLLTAKELRDSLTVDLGRDVMIEQLVIESEQIICWGKITINN